MIKQAPRGNMPGKIEVVVENRMITVKRDIHVFHYSTGSAHIISHNSSVTLPVKIVDRTDYLQLFAARGPGHLWKHCLIRLPSWADFEFAVDRNVTLIHSHDSNSTLLKIPPGPPTWELKIAASPGLSTSGKFSSTKDYITISDDEELEGGLR